MSYTTDLDSLSTHIVPEWFHNRKLGIFIHWGLYSVPGWATPSGDITKIVEEKGWRWHFAHNPYAEWYLNTLRIEGSPTQQYHFENYGRDFAYEDFRPIFDAESAKWDPDEWANLFAAIGAGYVVHTSRHADSFCLWPSTTANPTHGAYHSRRNIVGDITEAVRGKGLRMGIYYCGGMDWTFRTDPVVTQSEVYSKIPQGQDYIDYVTGHWKELIDRFRPDLMWNDIAWPRDPALTELFAYYYNAVPDGVINDRFTQQTEVSEELADGMLMNPAGVHYDFRTPEYSSFGDIQPKKWESCRGIGHSFGYNRMETDEHYAEPGELIRSFVDIVSKNGNLLLNVGPTAAGEIVEPQRRRLEAIGRFMEKNGEGINGTRPWLRAADRLEGDVEVRYTAGRDAVYMFVLGGMEHSQELVLPQDIDPSDVQLLGPRGAKTPLPLRRGGDAAVVDLSNSSATEAEHGIFTLRLARV